MSLLDREADVFTLFAEQRRLGAVAPGGPGPRRSGGCEQKRPRGAARAGGGGCGEAGRRIRNLSSQGADHRAAGRSRATRNGRKPVAASLRRGAARKFPCQVRRTRRAGHARLPLSAVLRPPMSTTFLRGIADLAGLHRIERQRQVRVTDTSNAYWIYRFRPKCGPWKLSQNSYRSIALCGERDVLLVIVE